MGVLSFSIHFSTDVQKILCLFVLEIILIFITEFLK